MASGFGIDLDFRGQDGLKTVLYRVSFPTV